MSHITVQIITDNDALTGDGAGMELARILNVVSDTVQDGVDMIDGMRLFDVNGNRVGDVTVTR